MCGNSKNSDEKRGDGLKCATFLCLLVGSVIDANFSSVRILHVQEDPAYNPYFGLNNQSSMLYSKVSLNQIQVNVRKYYKTYSRKCKEISI